MSFPSLQVIITGIYASVPPASQCKAEAVFDIGLRWSEDTEKAMKSGSAACADFSGPKAFDTNDINGEIIYNKKVITLGQEGDMCVAADLLIPGVNQQNFIRTIISKLQQKLPTSFMDENQLYDEAAAIVKQTFLGLVARYNANRKNSPDCVKVKDITLNCEIQTIIDYEDGSSASVSGSYPVAYETFLWHF